jgi:hypothetical protein
MASEKRIEAKEIRMKPIFAERPLPRDGNSAAAARRRSVTVNLAESPLTWLHARNLIDDRQLAAGELLRRDYERSGLSSRTTMLWDAPPQGKRRGTPGSGDCETLAAIDAKRRFLDALERAGRGLADILWRVVCAGERIPAVEREFGWPQRAGKLVLTLALDRVADYYRVR